MSKYQYLEATLVIDCGSYSLRWGTQKQDVPNVVCLLKENAIFGNATQLVKDGIIQNWDNMSKLWEYCLKEQSLDSSQSPILLTEPPMNAKVNKEKATEILIETFKFPGVYFGFQSVLSLYSLGNYTGCCLDVGHETCQVCGVYEGSCLDTTVDRYNFGGNVVSVGISKFLFDKQGVDIKDPSVLNDIKDRCCFVSADFAAEKPQSMEYKLPDGKIVHLDKERYVTMESLFTAKLLGNEVGVAEIVQRAIGQSEIDLRKAMAANIVISGGATMAKGFPQRLQKDLDKLCPQKLAPKVVFNKNDRQHSPWLGGTILAASMPSMMYTQKDYQEFGAAGIHTKVM